MNKPAMQKAQTVPEGYKQTEVGVTNSSGTNLDANGGPKGGGMDSRRIPEDWDCVKIGDVLSIRHGKDQKLVESDSGSYPIYGTGGLMGYAREYLYNKPSVLIGRKGTINKPRYIEEPFWTVDTLFYSEVNEKYLAKFIFYKFCMINWESYNEASGVPSLNAKTIESVEIVVPSKKEQTAIANALSDVDALISELEKLIAKKQAIKTATMQQLLTGKTRLPQFATHPDGTKKGYKQTELGQVPEDWELLELGNLLSYEQPTKYLVSSSEYLEVGSTPVLTAGKSFLLGYTEENYGVYDNLPVIIFDDFTTDAKLVDFRFKVKSSAIKMLKPTDASYPISIIYYLLSNVDFVVGDHKRHWISEFSKLTVAWSANKEEQTAIATILSDMDSELDQLKQRLAKTRHIKQGMMQELLTGKTRLVS